MQVTWIAVTINFPMMIYWISCFFISSIGAVAGLLSGCSKILGH